MNPRSLTRLFGGTIAFAVAVRGQVDYAQYVNPFIGSEGPTPGQAFGGGDIFVGGALPFGVTKVGIDTTATNLTLATLNGGWTPDGNVTAISKQIRVPVLRHMWLTSTLRYDARERNRRRAKVWNHSPNAAHNRQPTGQPAGQQHVQSISSRE